MPPPQFRIDPMKFALAFFLAALVVGGLACASSGGSTGSPDVITAADVENAGATYNDAYQVVARMQPQWLRKRSGGLTVSEANQEMEGDIVVYVDEVRMGGPDALRQVAVDAIARIEYLDPAKAVRYGTGHQHGAILVTTR